VLRQHDRDGSSNLLGVAVTRARDRLYLTGDRSTWAALATPGPSPSGCRRDRSDVYRRDLSVR
jgi:superfamily I DNA/RNA helicase